MVSFSCEECGDVLTKKKLDPHRNRCRGATFTCIDCMVHFPGTEYRSHTSCITEDQKYQGALYKPKRQKPNQTEAQTNDDAMAHRAYVEDAVEEYEQYQVYEVHEPADDYGDSYNGMPAAPMPPPAVPEEANVNVFDYMVDATPNASKVNFPAQTFQSQETPMGYGGGRQLIRFDDDSNNYIDESGYMVDDGSMGQYGTAFETPAPKAHRKKTKDAERELKKDKKRKRLHIETSPAALARTDEVMTDAPPVLHSGLTGGLNRMMRPSQFPPSPDYSGGDAGETSPALSIQKKKHTKPSKARRTDSIGSNLKALVTGTSKSKVSKKRKHSSERKEKKRRTHSHSSSSSRKAPKLIEFKAKSGDEKDGESGALVVFKPRSDLFLSLCNKGPESDRGCSVNKALKRYHRERSSSGTSLGKGLEEKELWRSLRMRRNERGEIVLFSLEEGQ
ncbi:hypothetical protein F5B22DRAFT_307233 [Xylaria bambusicola]|uniref:uncharacterized protein n=1 Tax=Xylaria bambusicola TaxID=326684 RepID=UPI002007A41F|nr:uncharacterized protein F5B22DRAFT_307233 [Xylaria bambusicola]KAI0512551.1 hypothetical protein F5B22DRAFT_307233 [Xylaria bambusicola]